MRAASHDEDDEEDEERESDDRPPICPACGVTMGMSLDEDGLVAYVCLECGFAEGAEPTP